MSNSQLAEKDQLYKIRHGAAHVMAEAVLELYPAAKIAIGPVSYTHLTLPTSDLV